MLGWGMGISRCLAAVTEEEEGEAARALLVPPAAGAAEVCGLLVQSLSRCRSPQ